MRWLWFVAAIALLAVTFRTHSVGLATISLLGVLVCILVGTLALASRRIESGSRSAVTMLSPEDMRQMRAQIEKRKSEGAAAGAVASGSDDADRDVDSVSSKD